MLFAPLTAVRHLFIEPSLNEYSKGCVVGCSLPLEGKNARGTLPLFSGVCARGVRATRLALVALPSPPSIPRLASPLAFGTTEGNPRSSSLHHLWWLTHRKVCRKPSLIVRLAPTKHCVEKSRARKVPAYLSLQRQGTTSTHNTIVFSSTWLLSYVKFSIAGNDVWSIVITKG